MSRPHYKQESYRAQEWYYCRYYARRALRSLWNVVRP